MKKLFVLFLLIASTAVAGDYDYRHGDRNLYTDNYGNTTGRIGDDRVNIHRDNYGNTTGRIGEDRVNLYTDSYGNTTGRIGDQRINIHDETQRQRSIRNW